jgi:hypothetical protein
MLNEERKELEYAQPLDINFWIDDPAFDQYIANLSTRLCKKSIKLSKLKNTTITRHLKIMLLNLWCVWLQDKKKYLFVSRDKFFYSTLLKQYNPNSFSYKNVVVMDALVKSKFIVRTAEQ